MISDLIHEARTEQEVFHLLNAYIEAVRGFGQPSYLPEDMATSPSCANDVMHQCLELMGELDAASKQWDDQARLALKEALHIFSNALNHLKLLERENHRSLARYVQVHGRWSDVRRLGAG